MRALLRAAGAGLLGATLAAAAGPDVVLVKTSNAPPFETATTAIVEALAADPLAPGVTTIGLGGDRANAPAVRAAAHRGPPRVIVTVGSLATATVLDDHARVPVVFSTVLYPEQSGFIPHHGRPVTGAALDLPVRAQFDLLHRLLPAARRVGVLYHAPETGAVVESIRAEASRRHLVLEARDVDDPRDALTALTTLMAEVDVVWAVADSFVFAPQATSALILASLRHRVPLVGLSAAHVRAGALAALSCDYADVGRQTAALVLRVLRGESAARIPVEHPRTVRLALNLRTAQHLGLTVPADLVAEADEVVR